MHQYASWRWNGYFLVLFESFHISPTTCSWLWESLPASPLNCLKLGGSYNSEPNVTGKESKWCQQFQYVTMSHVSFMQEPCHYIQKKYSPVHARTHIRKHIWSGSDSKGYGFLPSAVKLTNYSCSQGRRIGPESRILCHSLDSQRRGEMRLPILVAREAQVVWNITLPCHLVQQQFTDPHRSDTTHAPYLWTLKPWLKMHYLQWRN